MQSAETVTLHCILSELLSFEHRKLPFLPHTRVRSVTSKPFEISLPPLEGLGKRIVFFCFCHWHP